MNRFYFPSLAQYITKMAALDSSFERFAYTVNICAAHQHSEISQHLREITITAIYFVLFENLKISKKNFPGPSLNTNMIIYLIEFE